MILRERNITAFMPLLLPISIVVLESSLKPLVMDIYKRMLTYNTSWRKVSFTRIKQRRKLQYEFGWLVFEPVVIRQIYIQKHHLAHFTFTSYVNQLLQRVTYSEGQNIVMTLGWGSLTMQKLSNEDILFIF